MRYLLTSLCILFLIPLSGMAHGPSPQKVVKEINVAAEPAKVWSLVKDFSAIQSWYPDVTSVKTEMKVDTEANKELLHRTVTLKDGAVIIEKLREVNDADMKIDFKMLDVPESTILVSNYRTVIQVKPGAGANQSIVTITARFYNKANSMEAPPGMDNPTANKAINALYDSVAIGLQQAFK